VSDPNQPTIVVPIHNAYEALRACLDSLWVHAGHVTPKVLLIDDASDDPRVSRLLQEHAARPGATVLRHQRNMGYTATVNEALAQAGRDDVVLLNSDTRVTVGWLEGLLSVAREDPLAGTVTAMSDNAGAFSVPVSGQANPCPADIGPDAYAEAILAETRNCVPVQLPTGSGFCLWIRRAVVDAIGAFDEDAFPRGYGEENDFCMRAAAAGWRHYLSPRSFVFHVRSASFGSERDGLVAQADVLLRERYPDYHARVAAAFRDPPIQYLRKAAMSAIAKMAAKTADPAEPLPPVVSTTVQQIEDSGLFDAAWYLATYRDVERIPMAPLEHYLRFGTLLGRFPGPAFDARGYLQGNPDVEASGMNPLAHYVRHGRQEGRTIAPIGNSPGPTTSGRTIAPIAASAPKLPLTALVVTWDVGHNPLGRSYMLAEVLDRVVRNVVIAGFQFERYGKDVWEPVRDGRLPVIRLPGATFPAFLEQVERLAERLRPDIVFACKPRLPSLQLAAMIKHRWHCPLVLDIDDHELSFFKGTDEVSIADLAQVPVEDAVSHAEPYGELWTRLAQHLRGCADEIIVSNVALQREFGGTIVPHVRDERVFDPQFEDKAAARTHYGVPDDAKVVLFFGTPRLHKGIDVLARAVGQIADPTFRLVVVGDAPDRSVTAKLVELSNGRLCSLPNQPFSDIPRVLAMADVVCLPQDIGHPISQFQLPAKAIDAIGMGVPLLVSPTPPLLQLVQDGVARILDPARLPEMLIEAVAAADSVEAAKVRTQFLRSYSHAAAAETLRSLILRAQRDVDPHRVEEIPRLIDLQRRLFSNRPGEAMTENAPLSSSGRDVVVFWKQNDSGLYGRRIDMVVGYLASRADIRRVVVFDAPISEHELLLRRNREPGPTHDRLIYTRTYEKLAGTRDSDKVSHAVFVHPSGKYRSGADDSARPLLADAYHQYIGEVLAREGVDAATAIFWFYPKNYLASGIVDHFTPAATVVDVVDDHRAWPGVSDAERDRLTANYEALLTRADMSFANCETVANAMRGFAPAIRLVPNGCDADHRAGAAPAGRAFAEFAAFEGKIIGFVGNLEKKIDVHLIAKVAERFPDCRVVLLGSTHANPNVLQLRELPNVRMPGVVPYDEVGAWVSRFDVGIIPHLDMELTRSMNPLKLYVYLRWGVPVVSTEIYNVDRSHGMVSMASSHEEFLARIADVLAAGKPPADELQDYIEENSWSARFGLHVDALLSADPRLMQR
jgi:glycosyltransferase involved in cell wall biosynthesis/GT2 family glycosyltransferase